MNKSKLTPFTNGNQVTQQALFLVLVLFVSGFISGCSLSPSVAGPASESNLTPGVVKLTIEKNSTTQAEIVETFGPPDLVTYRDDLQIWTYDKISYDVEHAGAYLNILVAGTGRQRSRSSSTSIMLIIYFDKSDIVRDYRFNMTRF